MRKLHIFLLVVFALIILIGGEGYFYLNSLKPKLSGYKELTGLQQEVDVFFDSLGVPHIYAQNQQDLYKAFGYIHAQDRLWQMELVRRIASGRLSEIFGEELVDTDEYFRTLGVNKYSEKTAQKLLKEDDPKVREAVLAYLNGVNQFIEKGQTPIEFTILRIEKELYDVEDVANVMGYMAYNFAHAQRIEPILTWIKKKYGSDYINALDVDPDSSSTIIPTWNKNDSIFFSRFVATSIKTNEILDALPVSTFEGSNSWVVAPERSETGSVILVNDPHIGFSQPAVWYEAHLSLPDWDLTGFHLALQPFATMGHNRNIAIGMTMFVNDDMDFYLETVSPNDSSKYKYDEQWKDFVTRKEIIKVKDGEDVELEVKESVHGPIVNGYLDQLKEESPVALCWLFTKVPSDLLEVSYEFNHAKNIQSAEFAASRIHAPGLNIMYGDNAGNIAWWASAKLPKRPDHIHSKFLIDGSSSANEPDGFHPFSKNPHSVNPSWGYVYSANNQPDSLNGVYVTGHYAPEDRAKRIVQYFDDQKVFSIGDMKEMLLDHKSPVMPEMARNFIRHLKPKDEFSSEMIFILQKWNGEHLPDSKAPIIYQKVLYHAMRVAYQDELGLELLSAFRRGNTFKRSMTRLSREADNIWWDNIETDVRENMYDLMSEVLDTVATELKEQLGENISSWRWDQVHTLEHGHQLGRVDLLRKYFNIGPFNVGSSKSVLNNLNFGYSRSGNYKVSSGPSTRRIVDFSNIDQSLNILPTGNSGVFNSPHYSDQADLFNHGEFKTQFMSRELVEKTSKSKLTFIPPKYD
ncbi:MAG: penicillin acylase family protein [Bacteroidota bacterium]